MCLPTTAGDVETRVDAVVPLRLVVQHSGNSCPLSSSSTGNCVIEDVSHSAR